MVTLERRRSTSRPVLVRRVTVTSYNTVRRQLQRFLFSAMRRRPSCHVLPLVTLLCCCAGASRSGVSHGMSRGPRHVAPFRLSLRGGATAAADERAARQPVDDVEGQETEQDAGVNASNCGDGMISKHEEQTDGEYGGGNPGGEPGGRPSLEHASSVLDDGGTATPLQQDAVETVDVLENGEAPAAQGEQQEETQVRLSADNGRNPEVPRDRSTREAVCTIMVSNLPQDCKAREVYSLVRFFEGFRFSTLFQPPRHRSMSAFVTFRTPEAASGMRTRCMRTEQRARTRGLGSGESAPVCDTVWWCVSCMCVYLDVYACVRVCVRAHTRTHTRTRAMRRLRETRT